MVSRRDFATRFVVAIVAVGLISFVVVLVAGVTLTQRLADNRAIDQARNSTAADALLVQSRVDDGLLTGDAGSLARVAGIVHSAVLQDPVVRVKIWSAEGVVVYSDESRLIGSRNELGDDEFDSLSTGGVVAEVSDLHADENRYEQRFGEITEVYTRIRTPDGEPLLFETYQRTDLIDDRSEEISGAFTPVLIGTLSIAMLLEFGLATMLIRRIRRGQRERERLMREAVAASARERRRIAADLHDGPVQELAGLALGLAAQAEQTKDAEVRATLQEAVGAVRGNLRTLRSAIVGVYPANLEQTGLEAALSDLLARLPTQQIDGRLDYGLTDDPDLDTSELLYRAAQEAVRNAEKHAAAQTVRAAVTRERGVLRLVVADDGRGGAVVRDNVHGPDRYGLAVLSDLVRDAGGRLWVDSATTGTRVRVEVPWA